MKVVAVSLLLTIHLSVFAQGRPEYGLFPNPLQLQMERDADGRNAKLLMAFSFVDVRKKTWTAPSGTMVDGASIPRALWTIIGSPWTGRYREASVVHDYYCVVKTESWRDVHRVFYEAMLASGVDETQAKIMYAAVYRFGPRWNFQYTPKCTNCLSVPHNVSQYSPVVDAQAVKRLKAQVESGKFSLEQIEKIADDGLFDELQLKQIGNPVLIQ